LGFERNEVLTSVRDWFSSNQSYSEFIPGETPIPVSGKVIDEDDIASLVDACLDGWLTAGRFT